MANRPIGQYKYYLCVHRCEIYHFCTQATIGDTMSENAEARALATLVQALADLTGETVDLALRRAVQERLQRRLTSRAQAVALASELSCLADTPVRARRRVMAAA